MSFNFHKDKTPKAATNEASKLSVTLEETNTSTTNKEIDSMSITTKALPVIAGVEITTDSEGRFNLNALHKASGGDNAKRPSLWLSNKQTQELAEELSRNSCLGQEVIKTVRGGINPGTFAHELLAVEYAGWISPKFRLQVNQTFIDYRSGKLVDQVQIPQTLPEALRLAADLAEQKAELEHKVEEMQPDVKALERIAKSDGSMCVTDAAKQLQVRPKLLFRFLEGNRWIYRRINSEPRVGYQDKIQTGYLEHKMNVVYKPDGSDKTITQVRITPKGISKLAKMFSAEAAA